MKRTMILSAVTAACLLSAAGQAQVVISQVYGGGGNSGAFWKSDFVELKNIGSTPVNITGWSIQYASATGPSGGAPGNVWQVTPLTNGTVPSMILQPGQYFLIKEADGANAAATALPTPDSTGAILMSASNAKVALVNTVTPLPATPNPQPWATLPQVVDFVGYGTANVWEGTAAAPGLTNNTSAARANNGCQDTNDNSADFTVIGVPNPRNSTNTIPCGAAYPDVALSLSNGGCNPTVTSAYNVSATVANLQALGAAGTVATIVLPPALTYVSSTTGTGSATYDSLTRTVTWNLGTLPGNGSASLSIDTTVNAAAGLTVTGSVSTTTPNDPTGNNSATNFNDVTATGAPLSVIAVAANGGDTTIATAVDDNGTERKLGTIYRTFTSADGNWIIFRADLAGLAADINGAIVVGHNTAGTWSYTMVAREGSTAPVASMPNSKVDNNTFGNIQGINNSGQYVYTCRLRDNLSTTADLTDDILNWVLVKGTAAGGVSAVIKGGDTNHAGNLGADAATAPELAGRNYIVVSSSTIQNNGTVSFAATLSGATATAAAFVKNDGATLLAQKGVFVPANGNDLPMDVLDDDSASDGRGLMVSADGNSWIGTGEVQTAGNTTTDDNVVVVNGTVAVREGSPVGSFTDPAGWATFGSQQVPWTQMLPDASWYIHGYNPATAGFNQGQDWVERNGTLLASTGQAILTGSTETWADNVLQRTFFLAAGSGNDYVVGGLTNRSTAANGSDTSTDGVVVYRGSTILVREGAPVEVAPSDVRYLNLINDNRGFVAGGKLYMAATLRNANSVCNQTFTGLPQALVAVTLPATNACPADIGQQGGTPGSDGQLNNNDFIVFIDYFFAQNPAADVGSQGGVHGSDGQFNNNDFIVFIDLFFAGC